MPETYPFTEDGVRAAMQALGALPNAVAETLSRAALAGKPGDDCGCPVALYLQAVIQEHPRAGIYYDDRRWFACLWMRDLGAASELNVNLPDAVRDFVLAFDQGEYPDLIEEGSRVA